jgi:uncharacterized membrane protein
VNKVTCGRSVSAGNVRGKFQTTGTANRKSDPFSTSQDSHWKNLILASGLLYIAVRVYHLGYLALWYDEVFTVNVASKPWPGLFRSVVQDIVHPPLFYILLKVWIVAGGTSVAWMYLLPLMMSLAAVVPLVLFCREWDFSEGETLVALLLVTFNELLIHYSQELRMYSLLVLLSVTSLWLFSRFLHTGRGIVWLTIVNSLMVYTHYYGVLFIATELACILVAWSRDKNNVMWRFLASCVAVGLCFLPWTYLVHAAMQEKHGVIQNLQDRTLPRLQDIVWFYESMKGQPPIRHTAAIGTILFVIPVLLAFGARAGRRQLAAMLAAFAIVPTIASIIGSYVMSRSLFHPRYLIITVVPCLLLVGLGLGRVSGRPRRALAGAVIAWALVSGLWYTLLPNRKVPFDRLATQLASVGRPVYTYGPHEQLPLEFYGLHTKQVPNDEPARIDDNDFYLVYRVNAAHLRDLERLLRRGMSIVNTYDARDPHEEIVAVHLKRGGQASALNN